VSTPASGSDPALSHEEREALTAGLAQFNSRLFFECHDTLEEVWSGMRGPGRDFFQGLIQAAVGFYHLGNGNRAGGASVLRRSLGRLDRFPPRCCGVEVEPLRAAIRLWLEALESAAALPGEPPRIVFDPAGEPARDAAPPRDEGGLR
jgi:predicted metal-dependent hydrolase